MSKYDVDFNITSVELLPVHKRLDDIQNILYSLVAPLNELETIFTYLREGTAAGDYNPLTTYAFGSLVNYQSRLYYRNEVTDGYAAGATPNNTTYFIKVLDYTIGLDERIRFSPNKLILEYALNKIFGTTYNQPPTTSDIYITRNFNDADCFEIAEEDEESSTISESDTDSLWSIPEVEPDGSIQYDYTINIPSATWTALASTSQERDNIVLSVLSKYKLFGFIADINPY